jgi:hypothetical protein
MGLFGGRKPKGAEGPRRAEVSAQLLNDAGKVYVVSGDEFQPALDRIAGGKRDEGHDAEVVAVLLAAPDAGNPLDRNRIQVQINGTKVGYLSQADAKLYKPVMTNLLKDQLAGVCIANLRGGYRLSTGAEERYQVVLRLAPPDRALEDPPQEVHDLFDCLMPDQE